MLGDARPEVRYPSPAWFTGSSSWYEYPLRGLREVADVTIDESLDAESRSDLSYQVTAIGVRWPGQGWRRVYLDWCDFDSNHPHLIRKHDPPARYYKIQCRASMWDSGIRPIGQTISRMAYFDLLPSLRDAATGQQTNDVLAVFRTTARDLRCKAVEIVRAGGAWSFCAWVNDYPRREPANPSLVDDLMQYADHLAMQSVSKVNLALPGVGGDWTWRHVELLGMGAFMLTIEPEYYLPGNPAGAFGTCKRDLSDLAEKIDYWLEHKVERRARAALGRIYYEESLSPAAMARRLVSDTEIE